MALPEQPAMQAKIRSMYHPLPFVPKICYDFVSDQEFSPFPQGTGATNNAQQQFALQHLQPEIAQNSFYLQG